MLVVAAHATVPGLDEGGHVGVTAFFVLSGFLITSLLVEEREESERVAFGAFYARRALRLLPALCALVASLLAASYVLREEFVSGSDALYSSFYAGNWIRAFGGHLSALDHTWSLAIEEQFYIVWPALLVAALAWKGRRAALLVALVGVGASLVTRVVLWQVSDDPVNRVQFGTDTRSDALLVGATLALVATGRRQWVSSGLMVAVGLVGLLVVSTLHISGQMSFVWVPTLATIAAGLAVWGIAGEGYKGWLTGAAIVLIGRRSYGLYLWHVPIFAQLGTDRIPAAIPFPLQVVLLGALSWLMTVMSWRFVEQPFLRIKDGRASRAHAAKGPATDDGRGGSAALVVGGHRQ